MEVVKKYGINQFKFDGIGENTGTGGGGAQRDFDAMLKLIAELRSLKPDLYINQTTGTWPSPFWLLYRRLDLARRRGPFLRPGHGAGTRALDFLQGQRCLCTRSSAAAICIRSIR